MSYDLYLFSPRLTSAAFDRYFEGRPHYQDEGFYANKQTGVYFQFEFCDSEDGPDADPETPAVLRKTHVTFNLNYFRPHVFGLEAEPELTEFVSEFDCAIHDPQTNGMGDGPYSPEGFLRGWNSGNAFGYEAIRSRGGLDDVLICDDVLIEQAWRWNLRRNAAQESFGESHFLPLVFWAKQLSDGAPIAFSVWTEGVPTAFPDCTTHARLVRKPRLRIGTLFGRKGEDFEEKLMPIEMVASLPGCDWRDGPAGRLLLAPSGNSHPRSVRAAFDGPFSGMSKIASPVTLDHVLSSSIMKSLKG